MDQEANSKSNRLERTRSEKQARAKIWTEPDPPKQPDKCIGCVWGTWMGTKQFCRMPKCVKWWR